jgi:hypothetical protein
MKNKKALYLYDVALLYGIRGGFAGAASVGLQLDDVLSVVSRYSSGALELDSCNAMFFVMTY